MKKTITGYIKKMMNRWIKSEVQNGKDKTEAKHYLFNLRTKLKV
jgi:hypothetical protein